MSPATIPYLPAPLFLQILEWWLLGNDGNDIANYFPPDRISK